MAALQSRFSLVHVATPRAKCVKPKLRVCGNKRQDAENCRISAILFRCRAISRATCVVFIHTGHHLITTSATRAESSSCMCDRRIDTRRISCHVSRDGRLKINRHRTRAVARACVRDSFSLSRCLNAREKEVTKRRSLNGRRNV